MRVSSEKNHELTVLQEYSYTYICIRLSLCTTTCGHARVILHSLSFETSHRSFVSH